MLILPAYVYKDKDLHEVVIIGECVAVGALVMCLLFITVDYGRAPQGVAYDPGHRPVQLAFIHSRLGCAGTERLSCAKHYGASLYSVLQLPWSKTGGMEIPALCFPVHRLGCFHSHGHSLSSFQGLPARPFWNNPLLGPRFLASAFAAGPAVIMMVLIAIKERTNYPIDSAIFFKLKRIIVVAAVINLVMLFSEVFKEFYTFTHHSLSAQYLFFGLEGHDSLVPWIWTAIALEYSGHASFCLCPDQDQFELSDGGSGQPVYRHLDRERFRPHNSWV